MIKSGDYLTQLENPLQDKIFKMYGEQINGYCDKCREKCLEKDKRLCKKPISIFHVGSNFENDRYKILFVGKTSSYSDADTKEDCSDGLFVNATEFGRNCLLQRDPCIKTPYWAYLRDIIKGLYKTIEVDDEVIKNIALTNLVKCNSSGNDNTYTDNTPWEIKEMCIKHGIFKKEVDILGPLHIVFLTGPSGASNFYDSLIKNEINFVSSEEWERARTPIYPNGEDTKRPMWESREVTYNGKPLRVLRTYHPQGQKKEPFVHAVVDWVRARAQ